MMCDGLNNHKLRCKVSKLKNQFKASKNSGDARIFR